MGNILLIVDIQDAFLKDEYKHIVQDIKDYIAESNYASIIGTVFRNEPSSNFVKYLKWNGCMETQTNLVPCHRVILKSTYGLPDWSLNIFKTTSCVDIVGVDTDACVMAVAFQLFDAGINFRILSDMCYSSGGKEIHDTALKLMERNFGSAVII